MFEGIESGSYIVVDCDFSCVQLLFIDFYSGAFNSSGSGASVASKVAPLPSSQIATLVVFSYNCFSMISFQSHSGAFSSSGASVASKVAPLPSSQIARPRLTEQRLCFVQCFSLSFLVTFSSFQELSTVAVAPRWQGGRWHRKWRRHRRRLRVQDSQSRVENSVGAATPD